MLTKTGGKLVKEAVIGLITGGVRAGNLPNEDRKILKSYYGLDSDASLGWRNAGRGFLGEVLGRIPGNLVRRSALLNNNPQMATLGSALSLAGGIAGAKKGTDKYSVGRARELREQLHRLTRE